MQKPTGNFALCLFCTLLRSVWAGGPGDLFQGQAGQDLSGVLGYFGGGRDGFGASDFQVTVDWGDGSTSTELVVPTGDDSEPYEIGGDHIYASAGSYLIAVLVVDGTNQYSSTLVLTTSAVIAPARVAGLTAQQRRNDDDQATLLPISEATVALNTGGLRLQYPLDFDQSPGTDVGGNPALVYNSDTVSVRPVIEGLLDLYGVPVPVGVQGGSVTLDPPGDGSGPVDLSGDPVMVDLQALLTFNGVPNAQWKDFSAVSQINASYLLALQPDAPVTTTGVYAWTLEVQANWGNILFRDYEVSGLAQVVVRDQSPYGAGWGLDGVSQLVPVTATAGVPAGVLWVDGNGDSRFFVQRANGTYISPPGDFGTLVKTASSYIYTAPDQTVSIFLDSGYLSSVTDRDGQGLAYSYNVVANTWLLSTVAASDRSVTRFDFSNLPNAVEIIEPGPATRTVTLTLSQGNLLSITQPSALGGTDSRTFTYDSGGKHRLIEDQWAPLDTHFDYQDSGGLADVDLGLGSIYNIKAAEEQGMPTDPVASGTLQGVATLTDPRLNTTTYTLDAVGLELSEKTPDNLTTSPTYSWRYNAQNQVIVAIDPFGKPTTYTYRWITGVSELVRVDYPDGGFDTYDYEPIYHQVSLQGDGLGNLTRYQFNAQGDVTTVIDALKGETVSVWSNGLLMSVTDARNNITTYTYDPNNRRLQSVEDPLHNVTAYAYDSAGNLSTTTDARQFVTTFVYDERNRLLSTQTGDGALTQTFYLDAGQVSGTIDALGTRTSYSYDQRGWNTTIVEAVNDTKNQRTTTQIYDAAGNLESMTTGIATDPTYAHPSTTTYAYDVANRMTAQYEGWQLQNGVVSYLRLTTYAYDAAGQLLSSTTGMSNLTAQNRVTTSYAYDAMGRQTQVIADFGTGHLNATTTTKYDTVGNVVQVTDPMGRKTVYGYDALNRPTTVTEAAGTPLARTTTTDYDQVGNVSQVTDPLQHVTTYAYDADNRRIGMTEAPNSSLKRVTVYGYDAVGNLISQTDPRDVMTTYSYDALGRQTGSTQGVFYVSWSFPWSLYLSPNPQPVTITTYDPAGDVLSVAQKLTASTTRVTSYAYDALGRQTAMYEDYKPAQNGGTATYARGTTYAYDAADNLIGQTSGLSKTATAHLTTMAYQYDALNRLTESTNVLNATDPNDPYRTNTPSVVTQTFYDAADNVVEVTDPLDISTIYAYDALGRRTAMTEGLEDGLPVPETRTTHWQYDLDGELLSSTDGRGVVTSYGYDVLGRQTLVIQAYQVPNNGSVAPLTYASPVTQTSYNADDQMTQVVDPLGRVTKFGYDVLGRQTSVIEAFKTDDQRTTTSAYDPNDNLISQTSGQSSNPAYNHLSQTAYTYDALNRVTQVTQAANLTAAQATTQLGHPKPVTVTAYDVAGRVLYTIDPANHYTSYTYDSLDHQIQIDQGVYNPASRSFTLWRSTTQTYDVANNLLGVTSGITTLRLPLGQGFQTTFQSRTAYAYDSLNRLRLVRNAVGTSDESDTQMTYDADGNLQSVISGIAGPQTPTNYRHLTTTTYDYDALNRRIATTVGAGATVNATLTDLGHPAPVTKTYYDANNNVIGVLNPLGVGTSYSYDALNRQVLMVQAATVTDPTLIPRDRNGQQLTPTTATVYDAVGNVRLVQNPNSNLLLTFYDNLNRPTMVIQGLFSQAQSTATYVYDAADNVVSKTTGISPIASYDHRVTTNYVYDTLNRLIQVTQAVNPSAALALGHASPVTGYTYFADGKVNTVTVYIGALRWSWTTNEYDGLNHLIKTTVNAGYFVSGSSTTPQVTSMSYDALDRLTAVTNSQGLTTYYQYDYLGRQTVVQVGRNPGRAQITSQTYDAAGNLVSSAVKVPGSSTQPFNITRYVYDSLNRRRETIYPTTRNPTTQPQTPPTYFRYDAAGNLIDVYQQQQIGRLGLVSPGNGQALMQSQGMTVWNRTHYVYDALNRNIAITYPVTAPSGDASGQPPWRPESLSAYDAAGNLTLSVDSDSRIRRYDYDSLGRVLTETWLSYTNTGLTTTAIYRYSYDAAGNRTASRLDGSPQLDVTTQYDALNRPKVSVVAYGVRTTYSYSYAINSAYNSSQWVQLVQMQQTIGSVTGTTTSSYDPQGHLLLRQFATGSSPQVLMRADYANDRLSTLTYASQNGTSAPLVASQVAYEYDPDSGQISEMMYRNGIFRVNGVNLIQEFIVYQYDSDGRLVGQGRQAYRAASSNGVQQTDRAFNAQNPYAYDATDQVISDGSASGGTQTYTYDASGNRLVAAANASATQVPNWIEMGRGNRYRNDVQSNSFLYDNSGDVTGNGGFVYTYDNAHHLISAVGQGTTITYTYDAAGNLVARSQGGVTQGYDVVRGNVLAYLLINASNQASVQTFFVRGDGSDQLWVRVAVVAQPSLPTVGFFLTDRQGSVLDLVDAYGWIVTRQSYTAFGEVNRRQGPPVEFGYTGRPMDPTTYLQNNQARWYSAQVGRWMQEDPTGLAAGDTNLYRYVGNSPTNANDPSGKFANIVLGGAIGGVIGGAAGGIMAAINGEDVSLGISQGLITGAVVGATAGMGTAVTAGALGMMGLGTTAVGSVVLGAASTMAGGALGDYYGQYANWALKQGMGPGMDPKIDKPFQWNMGQTVAAGLGAGLGYGIGLSLGRVMGIAQNSVNACGNTTAQTAARFAYHGVNGALGGAIGDALLQGVEMIQHPDQQWSWTRLTQSAVTGAISGMASYAMMRACFAAGTPIVVGLDGASALIETIRVGDWVLSCNEEDPNGALVLKRVEELFVRWGRILHVHVRGRVIRTTPEHPFWVRNKQAWVPAGALEVGDVFRSHDGQWVTVEEVFDTGEYETVYNFRVADFHTYFVGGDCWAFSVWAHNQSCENPRAIREAVDTIENIDPKRAKNIATYAQRMIQNGKSDTEVIAYLTGQGVDSAVAARGLQNSKLPAQHGGPITPEMKEWAAKNGLSLIDPGDPAIKDLRARYMGDTPEKGSDVHKAVITRMLDKGELQVRGGVIELPYIDPNTKTTMWIDIRSKDVHMGHIVDAVTFWNQTGRFTGAKSAEVRTFMTDASNYALQYKSNNIVAGNQIEVRRYLPPPVASLPVIG